MKNKPLNMGDVAFQATVIADLSYLKEDIADIKRKMEGDYVTKDQFEPVRKIVYGLVAILLTSVVLAVVALVIKQ